MSENDQRDQLNDEELEVEGEALPDREAMSVVPLPDPIGGFTLPYERPTPD